MKKEFKNLLQRMLNLQEELPPKQKGKLLKITEKFTQILGGEDFSPSNLMDIQEELEAYANTQELDTYVQNEIINIIADIETLC